MYVVYLIVLNSFGRVLVVTLHLNIYFFKIHLLIFVGGGWCICIGKSFMWGDFIKVYR